MQSNEMIVQMHDQGISGAILKYVVIIIREGSEWIMARHRERETWEFAGGHIEPGETPDEAAARELYEETGALEFTLAPVSIYSVNRGKAGENYGKLYIAEVSRFGPLPSYEMAEIRRFREFPEAVTYPQIYPHLIAKVGEWLLLSGESALPKP